MNSHLPARAPIEVFVDRVYLLDPPIFAVAFAVVKTAELLALETSNDKAKEMNQKAGNGNG